MTWNRLLAGKDVEKHKTSRGELNALRALIRRDLADAAVKGLSDDRRFATAYNAALQTASMAIACAGYRITSKTGHHKVSFQSAGLALGPSARTYTDFFEFCRRKRNVIDYDRSHVATATEADEILEKAHEFYDLLETWITANHPALKK